MNAIHQPTLFDNPHHALTFAYRFSTQQYSKSAMGLQLAGRLGSGKGLVGLEGAAQAGMIQSLVRGMGNELHEAIIMAKYLPPETDCGCGSPCCSGTKANLRWNEAVRKVGDMAIAAVPGQVSYRALRHGIVFKHYGGKADISQIAAAAGVHRNTVSKQMTLIFRWLRGMPTKDGKAAERGVEGLAIDAAVQALEQAGILGYD